MNMLPQLRYLESDPYQTHLTSVVPGLCKEFLRAYPSIAKLCPISYKIIHFKHRGNMFLLCKYNSITQMFLENKHKRDWSKAVMPSFLNSRNALQNIFAAFSPLCQYRAFKYSKCN